MSADPKYILDERINLAWLSKNPNTDAVRLLEQNPDKINWTWL